MAAAGVGAAAGTCWSLLLLEQCSTWEALPARGLARSETLTAAESPSGRLLPAARLPSRHHAAHAESCAVPLSPCCSGLPELPGSTCQQFPRCCHWAPRCTRPSPSDMPVWPLHTHTHGHGSAQGSATRCQQQAGSKNGPVTGDNSPTGRPQPDRQAAGCGLAPPCCQTSWGAPNTLSRGPTCSLRVLRAALARSRFVSSSCASLPYLTNSRPQTTRPDLAVRPASLAFNE